MPWLPTDERAMSEEPDRKEEEPSEPVIEEPETDAKPEKAKVKIKEKVRFLVPDTTLNVMHSEMGNMMMPLSQGGIKHFYAGARANVGIKSGRYMFEVKIIENMAPPEDQSRGAPRPRNALRIGFSTAGSNLVMGDSRDATAVYFDSEGSFVKMGKRRPTGRKFTHDDVVAVVLNLDATSPNCYTVSLFKDGVRASTPQPLPEGMRGKPLYPTVSFKQQTIHVNFGPKHIFKLPFVCRTLQEVALKDCVVTSYRNAEGKGEVILPVGLPGEGAFDWLDMFMEKNPGYTELSDRALLDWAERSGINRKRGYKERASNDKPELSFGLSELEDDSVRKILKLATTLQQRNFVVMELGDNLLKEKRQEALEAFPSASFKRVARVVVGEPSVEFMERTRDLVLKDKQAKADREFREKKDEEKKKKAAEKKAKHIEKKKAEKEKKRKLAEAGKDEADEPEAKKAKEDEEAKEEEKKEEEDEEEEEDAAEEEPPKVELNDEEEQIVFRKSRNPDMTPHALNGMLTHMSLPESEEGFEEIKYEWSVGPEAEKYLVQWTEQTRLNTRIEDIKPSEWFKSKWSRWLRFVRQWKEKQRNYKAALQKKEAAEAMGWTTPDGVGGKGAKGKGKGKAAAEAAKEDGDEKMEEAKEEEEDDEDKDSDSESKSSEDSEDDKAKEDKPVDFETLDVFSVEDVRNIGAGVPLFKEFGYEDWAMMNLRFELYLLAHAFIHDVEDKGRTGIHMDNLPFYYDVYYKKRMNPRHFGVETPKELVDLVNDAIYVTHDSVVKPQLDAEMDIPQVFVHLTEEARRYRKVLLAVGDEAATLNLNQSALDEQAARARREFMHERRGRRSRSARRGGRRGERGARGERGGLRGERGRERGGRDRRGGERHRREERGERDGKGERRDRDGKGRRESKGDRDGKGHRDGGKGKRDDAGKAGRDSKGKREERDGKGKREERDGKGLSKGSRKGKGEREHRDHEADERHQHPTAVPKAGGASADLPKLVRMQSQGTAKPGRVAPSASAAQQAAAAHAAAAQALAEERLMARAAAAKGMGKSAGAASMLAAMAGKGADWSRAVPMAFAGGAGGPGRNAMWQGGMGPMMGMGGGPSWGMPQGPMGSGPITPLRPAARSSAAATPSTRPGGPLVINWPRGPPAR